MPKGGKKRSQKEYEKEIADAVKRFKKYPERMKYAYDEEDWLEFLAEIGVYPNSIEAGRDFFERVRQATVEDYEIQHREIRTQQPRMLSSLYKVTEKASVYLDTTSSGSQYREVYSGFRTAYRNPKTGRFEKRLQ